MSNLIIDIQKLWSSVAVAINTSLQESAAAARAQNKPRGKDITDLDTIPLWGRDKLDESSYHKMNNYLVKVNNRLCCCAELILL